MIDKIPFKRFYSDTTWQQGYAVRVGRWKFYNYAHIVGIRQCAASGFQNDQLFNELKSEYSNYADYESYMQLTKSASEWALKQKYRQSYQVERLGKLNNLSNINK